MDKRKKILFSVSTEYHLILACSLIFEKYNEDNNYEPYILFLDYIGSGRFSENIDYNLIPAIQFQVGSDFQNEQITAETIKKILAIKLDVFVLFHEQHPINVFLAKRLSPRGILIVLAPDGMKPYFSRIRLALFGRAKQTFITYRKLFKSGIPLWKPYFLSWLYARIKEVDIVWVIFPEAYKNISKKKVEKISLMQSNDIVSNIASIYRFDPENDLEEKENIIFYVNNIVYEREIYDFEIEMLKEIKKRNRDKHLVIKYHPHTPDFQLARFTEVSDYLIAPGLPAELYIINLKKSIILSSWSAALLTENSSCKYYWIWKIYERNNIMIDLDIVNPTNHIVDIDDLDKIEF